MTYIYLTKQPRLIRSVFEPKAILVGIVKKSQKSPSISPEKRKLFSRERSVSQWTLSNQHVAEMCAVPIVFTIDTDCLSRHKGRQSEAWTAVRRFGSELFEADAKAAHRQTIPAQLAKPRLSATSKVVRWRQGRWVNVEKDLWPSEIKWPANYFRNFHSLWCLLVDKLRVRVVLDELEEPQSSGLCRVHE